MHSHGGAGGVPVVPPHTVAQKQWHTNDANKCKLPRTILTPMTDTSLSNILSNQVSNFFYDSLKL